MSPSSLSPKTQAHAARIRTRLHLSSQPEKVTTCIVLNDCSDDSGILADIADQNVLPPKELIGQTLLTPTVNVCAVDNDDEAWFIETDYKSGWDTRFKSGMYRRMPNGVVLPKLSEKGRATD